MQGLSCCVRRAPVHCCMHQHVYAHYKSQTLAVALFGHRNMLLAQVGMSGAALAAAVAILG